MENKKDKQLQKLFDDYSPDFAPNDAEMLENAKKIVREKREKSKRSSKRGGFVFGGIALAAGCLVFVLFINMFIQNFRANKGSFESGELNSTVQSEAIIENDQSKTIYYANADLKFKSLSSDEANAICTLNCFSDLNMVDEKYYGYYFKEPSKNNELAFLYVKAAYLNENGRCDVDIIIEKTDAVYDEAKQFLSMNEIYKLSGLSIKGATTIKDGEFYSKEYFEQNGFKFYIQFVSPTIQDDDAFLEKLIEQK